MTFCIGLRVRDGVVVLSDTRVVTGSQMSKKSKMSTIPHGTGDAVIMSSGLRSVRDKVVARLEDRVAARSEPFRRFHEFATAYGDELRTVRAEDEAALKEGGLTFNSNAILAGRCPGDDAPVLMHVYPEGNWVEATDDSPYLVIGRSSYARPLLDRLVSPEASLGHALSLAYLAFDATGVSATDVDHPIDVGVMTAGHDGFTFRRYDKDDVAEVHDAWHESLRRAVDDLPVTWSAELFESSSGDERR